MRVTYAAFFEKLAGHPPFPYQEKLATTSWPILLDVPTGLGKTAAVVLAWMYKRLVGDPDTGTRLVYCLPMRVLVEQTQASATRWCEAARPSFEAAKLTTPRVHVLMGGDVDVAWELEPERPAILIGTQDMLLSRALNRGYAMSRYKWPVHFSLLNNDCMWVFDETQLVGVGIETSAQLQAFREKLGTLRTTHTLWMSATLGNKQLSTVDHPAPDGGWRCQTLGSEDAQQQVVRQRTGSVKPIARLDEVRLDRETDKKDYVEVLSKRILLEHAQRRGLTLVVVNRVARAQALFQALLRIGSNKENTALVHARFRSADRKAQETLLLSQSDRIVVATQAVEAGVDVSARTLFTELAPWPSLVQRFGRCNRYGGEDAAIFWIDIDTDDVRSGLQLPYERDELNRARDLLKQLQDMGANAGPQSLREIAYEAPSKIRPVLRRRDLIDLFDTTPDLFGHDLDISRYVRDGEDNDIQIYWRKFDAEPSMDLASPQRAELCRVSVHAARAFAQALRKKPDKLGFWSWNSLERKWQPVNHIFAGQVLLLHAEAGGYDVTLGWTGDAAAKAPVPPLDPSVTEAAASDTMDGDRDTEIDRWVRLDHHLGHVHDEAAQLATALGLTSFGEVLTKAGLWHDVGKAHPEFQQRLLDPIRDRPDLAPHGDGPWAKSSHRLKTKSQRTYFRHELASALAWLQAGDERNEATRFLVAYLVAAHHGKVRLSLRSIPGEVRPDDPTRLFARGVWDGDELISFTLPNGRRLEQIKLELSPMRLGAGSWLERVLGLRDAEHLGPFRLALLETVVRVADWRASRKEQEGGYDE